MSQKDKLMPRSRMTLNKGLAELPSIIPELDPAERAMLIGILADSLIKLVGMNGSFYHVDGLNIYRICIIPEIHFPILL